MEKQTQPSIMYENLVNTKQYASMYGINQKTVYEMIHADRLTLIEFLGRRWLDKTIAPKPTLKQLEKQQTLQSA